MPDIQTRHNEVLATSNPLGVKGVGEAGVVGSLVAAINAIVDALSELGVEQVEMPATAERIWAAIAKATPGREESPRRTVPSE